MFTLLPCPGCSRHVRRTETGCPFCGADVVEAMKHEPPRRVWNGPVTRSLILFGGLAAIGGLEACGGSQVAEYGAPHYQPDASPDAADRPD